MRSKTLLAEKGSCCFFRYFIFKFTKRNFTSSSFLEFSFTAFRKLKRIFIFVSFCSRRVILCSFIIESQSFNARWILSNTLMLYRLEPIAYIVEIVVPTVFKNTNLAFYFLTNYLKTIFFFNSRLFFSSMNSDFD